MPSKTIAHPAYHLYQLVWTALDWIYPPLCGGCEKPGIRWCIDCQNQTTQITENICRICGRRLPFEAVCVDCIQSQPPFTALRAWAEYNGQIRNAIHRLKYMGDIALAELLARYLIQFFYKLSWSVDIVTAVPLGVARLAQRGYNQASLLAIPLALGIGKPYNPKALSRIRETRSQVGLSLVERHENVMGAFAAPGKNIKNKSILVVDDVTTTGSTMASCAGALLEAGVKKVYGITLARPVFEDCA